MIEVTRTPVLEAKTSTGKNKYWFGRVLTDGTYCYLQSEAWTVNEDGKESKHLVSMPAKVTPKNVGRSNETTSEEQARAELQSKFQRQQDKGYQERGQVTDRTFTLPMLAHSIRKKMHTVVFPSYIQPKYNGIRCLYNSSIGFWTRQANEIIRECTKHLQFDTRGYTVDGELLLPPPYTFQQSISAIKKFDPQVSPQLYYVLYDVVDTTLTFRDRWALLQRLAEHPVLLDSAQVFRPVIQLSPTHVVEGPDDIARWHTQWVGEGFEGSIVRRPGGMYTPGHRNDALLKCKDFKDEEFQITGFEEGKGKDEGAIIFVCVTPEGREFRVRPEGPYSERQRMFEEWTLAVAKNGPTLLNKSKLTVRYQTLTDDRVPLFPVGVAVRNYE